MDHQNSPQGLNISSIRVFDQIRDPEIPINLRPPFRIRSMNTYVSHYIFSNALIDIIISYLCGILSRILYYLQRNFINCHTVGPLHVGTFNLNIIILGTSKQTWNICNVSTLSYFNDLIINSTYLTLKELFENFNSSGDRLQFFNLYSLKTIIMKFSRYVYVVISTYCTKFQQCRFTGSEVMSIYLFLITG